MFPAEPFVVQTWSEDFGILVPEETISFARAEQAEKIAAFAARRRAGVVVYHRPADKGGDAEILLRLGRTPRHIGPRDRPTLH